MEFLKRLFSLFAILSSYTPIHLTSYEGEAETIYHMVTASIVNEEVVFNSNEEFQEAVKVGFFRIKAPPELNLEAGRIFAKTFTSNPRYNQFGVLDVVNGYLQSEMAQTVRFTLERDHWNKCYINQQEVEQASQPRSRSFRAELGDGKFPEIRSVEEPPSLKEGVLQGPPNYPLEIQQLGHQIHAIGMQILRSLLKHYDLPEALWFEATAGASHGEGSLFLLFNCYDPKLSSKPYGVGAHKDWGHISILDVTEPGLQAKIDGEWRSLYVEDGYLIVNFGYVLEKLLPSVAACEHRVVTQKEKMRTSTVVFIDPRVGLYPGSQEKEGYVYDWNTVEQKLVNGEPTTSFFAKLSKMLYGENQSGKGD